MLLKKRMLYVWTFMVILILTAGIYAMPETMIADGQEQIDLRMEHQKVFQKATGNLTTMVSRLPLHYRNMDGKWEDIDVNLEESMGECDPDGEPFGYKCVKNSLSIYLPKHSQGWVQVRSGEYGYSFKLLGGTKYSIRKNKNFAETSGDNGGVRLTVFQGALKEEIILSNVSAPKVYEYRLKLRNLSITKTAEGCFLLQDYNGKTVFMIPKFFMVDANEAYSEEVETQLVQQGNEYRLKVIPSNEWLISSERIYPVAIDPTTIKVIGVPTDGSSLNGHNCRLIYYIPSNLLTSSTSSYSFSRDLYADTTVYVNTYADLFYRPLYPYMLPYDTKIKMAMFADTGSGFTHQVPTKFEVFDWNPAQASDAETGKISTLYTRTFDHQGGTATTTLNLAKGKAMRIEMTSATFRWWNWSYWTTNCWFQLECQQESMSPNPPAIVNLPAETPGTSVTVRWLPTTDEWNQSAWTQSPWNSITSIPSTLKAGSIKQYVIQRSTMSDFSTPTTVTINDTQFQYDMEGRLYYTFLDLTLGITHYFRIYGVDDEGNPTNINTWNETTNPSGPRWSMVTQTRCI